MCCSLCPYYLCFTVCHSFTVNILSSTRCNITNIMLEMDRILRPGGRVYIRDSVSVIYELREIADAMGWVTFLFDDGEGPHASVKLLTSEKRL